MHLGRWFRIIVIALPVSGQPLIKTDFGGQWSAVANNPRATGALPARWTDNSNWAQVWTDYQRLEESGRTYLRMHVTRIETGWGQIMHSLPRITEMGYVRLRIRVRSPEELAVSMGVRRTASPYNFLWQFTRYLSPGWRDYSLFSQLTPADYDVAFFILVQSEGAFDVSSFELERVTAEQLAEEFQGTAGRLTKNLLRNTRFPLGLQTGWMIGRDVSDGDVAVVGPDQSTPGPSGEPALRVRTSRATPVWSEPFLLTNLRQPCTASLALKGSGSVRLEAVSDGRTLAQRTVTATGEWQRASLTFTSPPLVQAAALRVEGSGEFFIDAIQVEDGSQATVFEPPGACEVALSVDAPTRVQFDDEPAAVRYAVMGGEPCATLRSKVVNLYDEEQPLAPVKLAGERAGSLDFAVFPKRPYGAFRIEAWVENSSGERVSPFNEVVAFRLRRPRYWMMDAPDSPFGVHTLSTTRHILMAKSIGVNWTRLHDAGLEYIGWYHLEPKPGEWRFFDDDIQRYRRYGLKVLGLLSTAPTWASHFDRARNGYYDRFYQPKDLKQYANYVRTVASRYQGVIDAWDIWNEPWNAGWWAVRYDDANQRYVTSDNPQADFARLQQAAFETAKSADPSLKILGINSTASDTGTRWTQGVVEAGGAATCDVFCYHQYTNAPLAYPGDTVEAGWRLAFGPVLTDGQAARPTWMTEGSPVNGEGVLGPGFYKHTLPIPDAENFRFTSDRMARYLASHLAQGNEKIFLYSMHTHTHFAGTQSPWKVLVAQDGYLHPSAAAHSTFAWLIEGSRFVTKFSPAEDVTAYLFEGDDYVVAVLAPRPGKASAWKPPVPEGFELLDLYGNVLEPGTAAGRYVTYLTGSGTAVALQKMWDSEPRRVGW